MNTATNITYWSIDWVDDDGSSHTKWFPLDVSCYGGDTWLWQCAPPLDGHEHILVCDRGSLLRVTNIDGEPSDLDVPTQVPSLVEVFAARPDGSVESMSTIREPITLNRPADGIDIDQILAALGYTDSGKLAYVKADGSVTYGSAAQIAAWHAAKTS